MKAKVEKQNALVIGFFLIRALCAISWREHPQPAKKDQFDVLTARGQSCAREYNDSSFPPYGFNITISSCSKTNITNSSQGERFFEATENSVFSVTEIEPFLPLNNFLKKGNFQTSVRWKSSFEGGASGGTGQQIPSFVFDYGISDSSLITINFSEADDMLYNLINGQKVDYNWQNYAFHLRKNY